MLPPKKPVNTAAQDWQIHLERCLELQLWHVIAEERDILLAHQYLKNREWVFQDGKLNPSLFPFAEGTRWPCSMNALLLAFN